MAEHRHDFHRLFWHFGPHRRQDVHLHPCDRSSCKVELVGMGRECDGDPSTHLRLTLTGRSEWAELDAEGTALSGRTYAAEDEE